MSIVVNGNFMIIGSSVHKKYLAEVEKTKQKLENFKRENRYNKERKEKFLEKIEEREKEYKRELDQQVNEILKRNKEEQDAKNKFLYETTYSMYMKDIPVDFEKSCLVMITTDDEDSFGTMRLEDLMEYPKANPLVLKSNNIWPTVEIRNHRFDSVNEEGTPQSSYIVGHRFDYEGKRTFFYVYLNKNEEKFSTKSTDYINRNGDREIPGKNYKRTSLSMLCEKYDNKQK